jgi:hypothetical protein
MVGDFRHTQAAAADNVPRTAGGRRETPCVMADVTSPQEAMARFKSLPAAQKMQIMAMLMRVQDDGRRR